MKAITRFALALATAGLLACSSGPPQPAPIAQYERDMARAQERFQEGRLAAAEASYRQAVTSGERFDDAARLAPALLGWAAVALELEDFAEAGARYREAAREAERAALPAVRLEAEVGAAETARRRGDCRSAEAAGEALLASATDGETRARIQLLLANCRTAAGEPMSALARLAGITAAQSPRLQAGHLASVAAAQLALGDSLAARRAATAALALDQRDRHPPAIAADHRQLAEIAVRLGEPEIALDHARRALRIYRLTGQSSAASRLLNAFPILSK